MNGEFIEGLFLGLIVGAALASWFWFRFEEKADQEELEADLALMSDEERAKFETAMAQAWEKADTEARIKRKQFLKRATRQLMFWRR